LILQAKLHAALPTDQIFCRLKFQLPRNLLLLKSRFVPRGPLSTADWHLLTFVPRRYPVHGLHSLSNGDDVISVKGQYKQDDTSGRVNVFGRDSQIKYRVIQEEGSVFLDVIVR
jgi:hypothetical protein